MEMTSHKFFHFFLSTILHMVIPKGEQGREREREGERGRGKIFFYKNIFLYNMYIKILYT